MLSKKSPSPFRIEYTHIYSCSEKNDGMTVSFRVAYDRCIYCCPSEDFAKQFVKWLNYNNVRENIDSVHDDITKIENDIKIFNKTKLTNNSERAEKQKCIEDFRDSIIKRAGDIFNKLCEQSAPAPEHKPASESSNAPR